MKKLSLYAVLASLLLSGCINTVLNPYCSIVFWLSKDTGCGSIHVYIDGEYAGEITHWQTNSPQSCTATYSLLKVSSEQGPKYFQFTSNCGSWGKNVDVDDDCFIYKVY